ncbi:hypothetical protein EB796_007494 [Bugula neritina]|uniref:Uncharacterized protein n=1 Tax=Bugula neritina TaxID=10212 RepID=A0A7J7K9B6_BUGNE|nr:hypothetical protein EB796_007494 [Bugula neritina]
MSIEEVWEKLRDYITEGDVDKFKETLTSLSAEDRLEVLCMQNEITDQAAERGHAETVKCILDSVPAADLYQLLSMQKRDGNTAVHSAAERGDTETVKCILDSVPAADLYKLLTIQDRNGKSAVHRAAEGGHTEIVKCILDSVPAADLYKLLSIQDMFGYTAVHRAAGRGHTETVKCILDSVPAADLYKLLSIQNKFGDTAVHSAAGRGHTETVKCILDSVPAADLYKLLSIHNMFGYTAVHRAAEGGHTETVKCILNSVPAADLYRLLIIRKENDSLPAADLYKLLSRHNRNGDTAVHKAAERGHTETMKYILDSVPATDLIDLLTLQNNAGKAVIHIITFNGQSELIKSLVERMSADEIGKLFSTRKSASDPYATRQSTLVGGKPVHSSIADSGFGSCAITGVEEQGRTGDVRLSNEMELLSLSSSDSDYETTEWKTLPEKQGKRAASLPDERPVILNPVTEELSSDAPYEPAPESLLDAIERNENLWRDSVKQTVYEAFVIAERKCANNNKPCKRVYAVAPAHLVLADKQNEEAAAADSFYMKQTTMQEYRTELNSRQLAGPPKKPDLANGQTNQTQTIKQ